MPHAVRNLKSLFLFTVLSVFLQGCQHQYSILFESDNTHISPGEPVTLSWSIETQEDIHISQVEISPEIGVVSDKGQVVVNPQEATRYKLAVTFIDAEGNTFAAERFVGIAIKDKDPDAFCFCEDDTGVDRKVVNYSKTKRTTGNKIVDVIRLSVPGFENRHSLSSVKNATKSWIRAYQTISRNRLNYHLRDAKDVISNKTNCSAAKGDAEQARRSSADLTIITVPCGAQHASYSKPKPHIKQNIKFIRHHEVGHVLGLGHSGVWEKATNSINAYGDKSSNMGRYGAPAYAASQLHGLGWTDPHDTVRITDYLNQAGYFEGKLRPIGKNAPGKLPMAYVTEVAYNDRRIWISAPFFNKRQIVVHSQRICKQCSGMHMGTRRLAVIQEMGTPQQVAGLAITLLDAEKSSDETYKSFLVRIEPANQPYLVKWNFNEKAGTSMNKLRSSGIIGSGVWTHKRQGMQTTGNGTLQLKPAKLTAKSNHTWFNLEPSANEPKRGKIWLGARINGMKFLGKPGERIKIGLTRAVKDPGVIAEFQLIRTEENLIHIAAHHGQSGPQPESGQPISTHDELEDVLEIVMEYDFDQRTYQLFYKKEGQANWIAYGEPVTLPGKAFTKSSKPALRLTTEGNFRSHPDEAVYLDELYLALQNPLAEGGIKAGPNYLQAPNNDSLQTHFGNEIFQTMQYHSDLDCHTE